MSSALMLLMLSALAVTSGQHNQGTPILSPTEDAELRKFYSLFPVINQQLGAGNLCDFCGCIRVSCSENGTVTILAIGQQDAGTPSFDVQCQAGLGCPADAFDVTLDSNAFPKLPELNTLRISSTDSDKPGVIALKGLLPDTLPSLYPKLEHLQVDSTAFTGSVPRSWFVPGVWPILRTIDLYRNQQLTGQLPDLPEGALPTLVDLTITDSPLGGTLPAIGKHNVDTSLNSLGLSVELYNLGLTGTLPLDFGAGSGLSQAWLYGNNLEGTLPLQWGDSGHFGLLKSLDLSNNSLTGSIPDSWGRGLYNLAPAYASVKAYSSELLLNSNELTGSIPASFSPGGHTNVTLYVAPGNYELCGATPDGAILAEVGEDGTHSTSFPDIVQLPSCG